MFDLDGLLRNAGVRQHVMLLWNAKNICAFERLDWRQLTHAARITRVSRYMKHLRASFPPASSSLGTRSASTAVKRRKSS
jgi:hypothetical protein